MNFSGIVNLVARSFADQVANGTIQAESMRVIEKEFDFPERFAEIIFDVPAGATLFHGGGDRVTPLPQGGRVLTLYDQETDIWGWYLFSSNILGEFSVNPTAEAA